MSRQTPRCVRSQGFTLVELLVVIGIIALLISILLPALNKARERANTVKCASQMKQLMGAVYMYTGENKGRFPIPPSCANGGDKYPGSAAMCLMYYMNDNAPNGAGMIRYDVGSLWPYIIPTANKATPSALTQNNPNKVLMAIMNCPTDNADSFRPVYWGNLQTTASQVRNYSYTWNQGIREDRGVINPATGQAWGPCTKISQVKQPGNKILLLEELAPNDGMCYIYPYDGDDEPAFRHVGGANYGFADGHVSWKSPTELGFKQVSGNITHTSIVNDALAQSYFLLKK